jgi:hypothetical protein
MVFLKIANCYGSVDVRDHLSKVYTHVRGKRLQPLCLKLNIPFAQALIGFSERGRRGKYGYSPVFDGVVVTAQSANKLLQAIEDRKERAGRRKPPTSEQRAAAKERRQEQDIAAFSASIKQRFPNCPDAEEIARHSCEIGSGRVGRSITADDPVLAAVIAHVRHCYTHYEEILEESDAWDREERELNRAEARRQVSGQVAAILAEWEKDSKDEENGRSGH